MVNWKNYEEYMLLHADGELSDAEQEALHQFVSQHPELQEELAAYESTRFIPDLSVVYADKEGLLKPVASPKVFQLGNLWQYGVAACLILMLLLIASRFINNGGEQQLNTPEVVNQAPVAPSTPVPDPAPLPLPDKAAQPASIAATGSSARLSAPATKHPFTIARGKNMETIEKLPMQAIATTPVVSLDQEPLHVADISMPPSEPAMVEEKRSGFLASLPLNEEKRAGLNNLRGNIDTRIEQAKTFKDNLKETSFALKLGGKDFIVINF